MLYVRINHYFTKSYIKKNKNKNKLNWCLLAIHHANKSQGYIFRWRFSRIRQSAKKANHFEDLAKFILALGPCSPVRVLSVSLLKAWKTSCFQEGFTNCLRFIFLNLKITGIYPEYKMTIIKLHITIYSLPLFVTGTKSGASLHLITFELSF